jgi:hypothetical protein
MSLRVYQARMVAQGAVVVGCFAWCASATLAPKRDPSSYNPYLQERLEQERAAAAVAADAAAASLPLR